jgi:hypothetical protein
MPEEYHDEMALCCCPYGGPVGGLDTSGIAAEQAGDMLDDIYDESC